MAYRAFSEFLRALDLAGELIRVTEPVGTELEKRTGQSQ
jgi:3-polyprenyl-4-hydroxybenzoate decarboxylase